MRERIVFFILGAVLATVAYFIGNVNKVEADAVGKYDFLTVDSLVVRSIIVSESGKAGDSVIGLKVENNVPSINISNRKFSIYKSGIMLATFSEKDPPGSIPMFMLIDDKPKENYTFTSSGVYRK